MVNCLISRLISTMSNIILYANTLIVNDGLTPKKVGIIDPSVTYNRSYFSFPVLSPVLIRLFTRDQMQRE
jgi:hypothetical protein